MFRNDQGDERILGTCCACGTDENVNNIVLLDYKNPTPGSAGWGCLVCDLPMIGAFAVLCDSCLESHAKIKFFVGENADHIRRPISELKEPHEHDPAKHGLPVIQWFSDSPDAGDPACICSWCGQVIEDDDNIPFRLFREENNTEARFHKDCFFNPLCYEQIQKA